MQPSPEKSLAAKSIIGLLIILGLGVAAYTLWPKSPAGASLVQAETAATVAPAASAGRVLTIGSISPDVKEEMDDFLPFTEFLAGRLSDAGVTRGNVVVVPTMADMAQGLKSGRIDLYVDSPFPALKVAEETGARPLVRRWKGGVGAYHSVLFTRRDSGVSSLDGLRGKRIAFDEPSSTTGYLLPKAALLAAGYKLQEVTSVADPVPADTIGYIFSEDDVNTMLWVLEERVAAGVLDNTNYREEAGGRLSELIILERSVDVPRHMVVHRRDLEPELVSALARVLRTMHEDEAGKLALEEFQSTAQFDDLPEGSLEPVRQLMARVQNEVGD